MSLRIRPGRDEDKNFILSTWLKSYRQLSTSSPVPTGEIYFKWAQDKIKKHLGSFVVACTDDSDQIVGYAVFEDDVLHYVYVKHSLRGFGVANKLLDSIPQCKEFTHFTRFSPFFKRRNLQFNPYRF